MNRTSDQKETSGSITVFLSLILLLILSLIFTIIEGARVGTAKVYAERSLSTAMDSVLAEYYGPLWEEYHIFGYYKGTGSDSEQKEQIENKLSDYMSYTFNPGKDLNTSSDSNAELYNITLNSTTVDNETLLMDYQGKLLINEAVEYMKYRVIGNGMEQLLDKMSLLESPEKISYVYEEKQKVEENLVEIDKGILELMELLDGLSTSEKGIEVSKDGALKTATYFVKKICLGEVTKDEVGINQEDVFQAIKDCYINPVSDFEAIETNFSGLDQTMNQIEEINYQISSAEIQLSNAQAELDELNAVSKKTKEDKNQIKALKNTVKAQKEEINVYEDALQEQENAKSVWASSIVTSKSNISTLIDGVKPVIGEAITAVDNIILKTDTAAPFIDQYEKLLYSNQEQIGEEVFSGLEENLNDMKKYIAVDGSGYDFHGMEVTLEDDLNILTQVEEYMNEGEYKLSQEFYKEAGTSFSNAKYEIQNYQIKGLTLDYSTLVLDNSAKDSSLDAVNNLLEAGITSLVIDPNLISKGELKIDTLPSEIASLSQENTNFLSQLTDFFKSAVVGGSSSGMSSLFNSFGSGTQTSDIAGDGVNALAAQLLYQEYLKNHFEMYCAEDNSASRKPSALVYEQEYLLAGKLTDQENLSSVISRIMFLRTILDFVSILGDSTRRNEARAAATALVGFTGLPILVGITQVLILLAWSFAEALLDVCALMSGKEVPVLKKQVVLQLPELFLINREFLQSKVSAVTSTKELSLSYQDYLRMFLFMKDKQELAYRTMDLMQENIKIRYEVGDFDITRCLYGYEADIDYTIPSKFTGITFVQNYLGTGKEGFHFTEKTAYSY